MSSDTKVVVKSHHMSGPLGIRPYNLSVNIVSASSISAWSSPNFIKSGIYTNVLAQRLVLR